jgi:hypothetical protein
MGDRLTKVAHDTEMLATECRDIPDLIRNAGDLAVATYTAFFEQGDWTRATRMIYQTNARRFFRFAAERGLTLGAIGHVDIDAYARKSSRHQATTYLTPVRGVFGWLFSVGVLDRDPFARTESDRSTTPDRGFPEPSIPLEELRLQVLTLIRNDSALDDYERFQAGLVVLSPLSLGTTDPEAISRFTREPLPRVQEFAGRLIANGCWSAGGKVIVDSSGLSEDALIIMLATHILVAEALVER